MAGLKCAEGTERGDSGGAWRGGVVGRCAILDEPAHRCFVIANEVPGFGRIEH